MRVGWVMALGSAACSGPPATGDSGGTTEPIDLSQCETQESPEVFLGRGVGGEFQALEPGELLGLSSAPQGGYGVSVLVGTHGLQAGENEIVTAELSGESAAVATSAATFSLDAILACKTDGPEGPQGTIYGVVVGFSSSLGNGDLLAMNGQPATLTVAVTDANGATASVSQDVTLKVGE